ncbi:phosphate signaling complex protein PhoU [Pseudorhodoferax sp. LjRoot39]|uniref:phosphate signaling complex protein PhoU n=1 Tax=Pseudorhodoferax sp. LjRoot39 TaxID=3342328 RepID=UPI003ECE155D
MTDKHLSSQFDSELTAVSSRVMEMGGLVEFQVRQAVYAMTQHSAEVAAQVVADEERVNGLEIEIDRDLSSIIARRQPTARDLRLLIAISKSTGNLERIGDEAARIARTVIRLLESDTARVRVPANFISYEGSLASELLRKALDAFARLDVTACLDVLKQDQAIDIEFEGLMRKLATYMMEDARTISSCIDLVFVVKALERIGDHAKNLAEQVIYIVKGEDVRHSPIPSVESVIAQQ